MILDELENNEQIEVMYNDIYGSWNISNKAKEIYKLRKIERKLDKEIIYISKRNDPLLIEIYRELKEEFDGEFSKTIIKKIPKIYENYYFIDKYDGYESVEIDYIKYELHNLKKNIKEIIKNENMDNYEKLNQINKVIR
jgi:hypothetical protein